MSTSAVQQIAAFIKDGSGGNSAGVVLAAEHLDANQRQALAAEAGFSETAFVTARDGSPLEIEYFTPVRQIEICGHATVGAFSLMRDEGKLDLGTHSFRSIIGTHRVEVRADSVGLWQEQLRSESVDQERWTDAVAGALGLSAGSLTAPLRIASNGSPFMLVSVSAGDLRALQPDFPAIEAISEHFDLVGFYVYGRLDGERAEARMFAPRYGIPEESATGMAAGALTLALHDAEGLSRLVIEQGHLMQVPSPSLLTAEVVPGKQVLVSGQAIARSSGTERQAGSIHAPDAQNFRST